MQIDRKELIASLGGEAAVKNMDHEARADALEDFQSNKLDAAIAERQGTKSYPTVAELESRIDKRGYRRGVGRLFLHEHSNKNPDADESKLTVPRLRPMPEKPTLIDFFNHRFVPLAHLLQSAPLPKKRSASAQIF